MPTKIRVGTALPSAPTRPQTRNAHRLGWLTASVAALVLSASTAQAGNEFENAFEDELGRIAAQHVAALGQLVVWGGRYPVVERAPIIERVHVKEVHVVKHKPRRHVHGARCGHRGWHKAAPHGRRDYGRGHGHDHHPKFGHPHGGKHDDRDRDRSYRDRGKDRRHDRFDDGYTQRDDQQDRRRRDHRA